MSYEEQSRRDTRLHILRYLNELTEGTSNADILARVVNQRGVIATLDQITTQLHWLAEQGFVELTGDAAFSVAQVTRRGRELAAGRTSHPDVQHPWSL